MPALIPTTICGVISWLGMVPDRSAQLQSVGQQSLIATFAGPEGEAHGGLTRPSCNRVLEQYARGTIIRNTRQFSIVSAEELAETAAAMGLACLDPWLVGATMVIEGIPDFTHIPPSSRLQGADGATLVVDMQNQSCQLPAKPIEAAYPGHGARYRAAARDRRGITAWVEREGAFTLGERMMLHVPVQRAWAGAGTIAGVTAGATAEATAEVEAGTK